MKRMVDEIKKLVEDEKKDSCLPLVVGCLPRARRSSSLPILGGDLGRRGCVGSGARVLGVRRH